MLPCSWYLTAFIRRFSRTYCSLLLSNIIRLMFFLQVYLIFSLLLSVRFTMLVMSYIAFLTDPRE